MDDLRMIQIVYQNRQSKRTDIQERNVDSKEDRVIEAKPLEIGGAIEKFQGYDGKIGFER
jgi:hypothetical protein